MAGVFASFYTTQLSASNLMTDFNKLLKVREAASLLSISERQLWQLTKDGKIPAVRLGNCVRYQRFQWLSGRWPT